MRMKHVIALAMGVAGVTAAAADTTWTLKAGLVSPQGDLRTLTQKSTGYGFEGGATLLRGEGLGLYVHGEYNIARRKVVGDMDTFDAKHSCVGLDLTYDVMGKLSIFTGPVIGIWDVTGNKSGAAGATEPKMGWRVGVDVPIYQNWGASISYVASEWRSDAGAAPIPGLNPSNPSYITVAVRYNF